MSRKRTPKKELFSKTGIYRKKYRMNQIEYLELETKYEFLKLEEIFKNFENKKVKITFEVIDE
jgi:hypothetical protein